jgi:solute carrier family 25 S-adenosylmethionine transporter 26
MDVRHGGSRTVFAQFIVPLVAGGIAGTTVDVVLFPLDTIKTRLQSKIGFWAAGGFRSIYAGIVPAAAGSAPAAATFFCTYELTKSVLGDKLPEGYAPFVHMLAASLGEVTSCLVRVPFELTKQRAQANTGTSALRIVKHTWRTEGLRGMYRGYFSLVFREIPFSFIQYPTWEYFKSVWSRAAGRALDPWQGAVCGAMAGAFAAAVTTPLDVAKTRIMLAQKGDSEATTSMLQLLLRTARTEGIKGLVYMYTPSLK